MMEGPYPHRWQAFWMVEVVVVSLGFGFAMRTWRRLLLRSCWRGGVQGCGAGHHWPRGVLGEESDARITKLGRSWTR